MPIPANPYGRYRAAGLTPGAISSWSDEGSGGNNLTQAVGDSQPTAEAAGFNGHPSVLFDGVDDFMATANYSSALSQPNTIVVMGEWVTIGDGIVWYLFDGNSAQRNALFAALNVGGDPYRLFAGTIQTATASPFGTAGDDVCIVSIFNGASSQLHVNDVGETLPGSVNTQALAAFTLNARFADSGNEERANFRYVEVLIYDRGLDGTEISDLQDYFVATYGEFTPSPLPILVMPPPVAVP